MTLTRLLCSSLACLLTAACGGDDEGSPAASGSPTISNLALTPTTIVAAQQADLQGSVDFADPEGDVATMRIEIRNPAGAAAPLVEGPLQGTQGVQQGAAQFTLQLLVPSAGAYPLEVWVRDSEGNDSNRLATSLTAQ